MANKEFNKSL